MTIRRSCGRIALAAALTFGLIDCVEAAIYNAASLRLSDVSAAVALAKNGDTVVLPAGAEKWTSTLQIAQGITLQGATVISGDHSTTGLGSPMAASDLTTIIDDVPRSNGRAPIINVSGLTPTQSFRMTGITFQPGTVTGLANGGSVQITGRCPNVRVDHCHFSNLISDKPLYFMGWCYGVVDHSIFDCTGSNQSIMIGMDSYASGAQGDGSWADGPNFGTNQFFFVEDNTFNATSPTSSTGTFDATPGGRFVERYNVLNNVTLSGGHGTETVQRGVRAREIYGNIIYPGMACCSGAWGGILRGGTLLTYNNTWVASNSNFIGGKALTVFRAFWPEGPWGAASGANAWDINDTEGNGTYVPGHAPHLYESGTHSGPSGATSLTDSSKSWTTNQWVNYTVLNTSNNNIGVITGNTSNTINFYLYNDQGAPLKFNNGDGYQIHKLILPLNGIGRGKGDLVKRVNGAWNNPVNSTTGTVAWTHDLLEPCYSWDSYDGNPVQIGPSSGQGTTVKKDRDYYNLNTGWTSGSPLTSGVAVGTLANRPTECTPGTDITGVTSNPPGVAYWATDTGPSNQNGAVSGTLYVCTSSNTWTQYYQPYLYPHPLVSGAPSAPAAPKNLRVVPH